MGGSVAAAISGAALVAFTVLDNRLVPPLDLPEPCAARSGAGFRTASKRLGYGLRYTPHVTERLLHADCERRAPPAERCIILTSLALVGATAYALWRSNGLSTADPPAYALTVVTALLITPANGSYNLLVAIFRSRWQSPGYLLRRARGNDAIGDCHRDVEPTNGSL